MYYENYGKVTENRGTSNKMQVDPTKDYKSVFDGEIIYKTPYVDNPYNLSSPIDAIGIDVSHNSKVRPSGNEYGWRNTSGGDRYYSAVKWHNGMDIFAPEFTNVNAVDDSFAFNYQIPISEKIDGVKIDKTPIQAVATIFLDQEKYGSKSFNNDVVIDYVVSGETRQIDKFSTYNMVKLLGTEALAAWSKQISTTLNTSYFTGSGDRKIAYASYNHVTYDDTKRPQNGDIFLREGEGSSMSLGGIVSGSGNGDLPMGDSDDNGYSNHLHFELFIPEDDNALIAYSDENDVTREGYKAGNWNFTRYAEGSVNPRKYINLDHLEFWN